jgi:hypothetical protein
MWKLHEKVLISKKNKKSEFIKSKQIKNQRSLYNAIILVFIRANWVQILVHIKFDYLNIRENMHSGSLYI